MQVPGFYDDVVELSPDERELFARVPHDERRVPRGRQVARTGRREGVHDARTAGRPADRRGQRHRGRLPGLGQQDDHPDRRVRQAVVPARRQPGPARDHRGRSSVRRRPHAGGHRVDASSGRARASPRASSRWTRPPTARSPRRSARPSTACRYSRHARAAAGPRPRSSRCSAAPLVFLGVGLPDDQIHAPNEKVNLSMLYRGAEAAALLWSKFAELGRAGLAAGGVLDVARAATLPTLSFPLTHHTLANGLRVVVAPDRSAPVVGIAVLYDVGIRSEPEGRTGFAHLFEHLMFQGSANLGEARALPLRAVLGRHVQRQHALRLHQLLRGAAVQRARARAVPRGRPDACRRGSPRRTWPTNSTSSRTRSAST